MTWDALTMLPLKQTNKNTQSTFGKRTLGSGSLSTAYSQETLDKSLTHLYRRNQGRSKNFLFGLQVNVPIMNVS